MYQKRLPLKNNTEFKIKDAVSVYKLADRLMINDLTEELGSRLEELLPTHKSSWDKLDLSGDVWNVIEIPRLAEKMIALVQDHWHFCPNDRQPVLDRIDNPHFQRRLLQRPYTEKFRKLGYQNRELLNRISPTYGDYIVELLLRHYPPRSAEPFRSRETEQTEFDETDAIRQAHKLYVAPNWHQFKASAPPAPHLEKLARLMVARLVDLGAEDTIKSSRFWLQRNHLVTYFELSSNWIEDYLAMTRDTVTSLDSGNTSFSFIFHEQCFFFLPAQWAPTLIFLIDSSQMLIDTIEHQARKAFDSDAGCGAAGCGAAGCGDAGCTGIRGWMTMLKNAALVLSNEVTRLKDEEVLAVILES